MAKISGRAHLPFIGCLVLVVATILHLTAFISPFWFSNGEWEKGLWKFGACRNEKGPKHYDCSVHMYGLGNIEDWFWAVRCLQAIAIPFMVIPPVLVPMYMYAAEGLHYAQVMCAMFFLTLLGAICTLASLVVCAINVADQDLRLLWCYVISCVGCACTFVALLLFLGSCISARPDLKRDYYDGADDRTQVVSEYEGKENKAYTVE